MDIQAIARAGVETAFRTAASVLSTVTLRDGPAATYDGTTDVSTVVWGSTVTTGADGLPLKAFLYEDKDFEEEKGEDGTVLAHGRMALLKAVDIATPPTTLAELLEGSTVWKVTKAERPPGGAIFILTLRDG